MKNQLAESLFNEYRVKVEIAVNQYDKMVSMYDDARFPILASRIWRLGMLSEIWGRIAGLVHRPKKNYLADWREGK